SVGISTTTNNPALLAAYQSMRSYLDNLSIWSADFDPVFVDRWFNGPFQSGGGGSDTSDDSGFSQWWTQFKSDLGALGIRPDSGDSDFQNLYNDLMAQGSAAGLTPDWTNPAWVSFYTPWLINMQNNGPPSGGGGDSSPAVVTVFSADTPEGTGMP